MQMIRRFHGAVAVAFAALALVLASPFAFAQAEWPAKPVRIIVPYTPGGFTDVTARIVAQRLQDRLKQPFTIDNKPGANGIVGTEALAKSAPDGYTFVLVIAAFSSSPSLYAKLPYDSRKDFMPVSLVGISPLVAAVNNDMPIKNAKELVAYAKANPGKISFGSSGNGAAAHLTTELFKSMTGVDMVHIPYKGTAGAMADLLGGRIQLLFDSASGIIPNGKAGKIRMIGISADQRLPAAPDVPTFIEQGFAGFTGSTWAGLLAPAGTPQEIVRKLSTEVAAVVRMEEVKKAFDELGIVPVGNTPAEFDAFIVGEMEKWGKVIREAKVKAE
ncbi:MFS transporter [Betaproteobacteria bacterium GR16-43]|nr:MFS transporter [Betaproteobacteria bacterium GR16-43]